jgi:hypothetical protein
MANEGLNGYVCFYNPTNHGAGAKRLEVYAATTFDAQKKAAEHWKVPAKKQYKISVNLCERADGSEVIHTPTF